MYYNYYYIEKVQEFEQKEKEQAARQYWKWALSRKPDEKTAKKAMNGK